MTPVEKAESLMKQFSSVQNWVGGEGYISIGQQSGRQCAIICVEQIIKAAKEFDKELDRFHGQFMFPEIYWEDVLTHIKNS